MQQIVASEAAVVGVPGTECHVLKVPVAPGTSGIGKLIVTVEEPGSNLYAMSMLGTLSRSGDGAPLFTGTQKASPLPFTADPELIVDGLAAGYLDVYLTGLPEGSDVRAHFLFPAST